MNKFYLFLALVFSLTAFSSEAQSLKRYKSAAAKATDSKDYAHSLEFYRKLIHEAEDKNVDNYYQAAESARKFRLPLLAESYYMEVLKDSIGRSRYPKTNLHLGTVRKSQSKYKEAIKAFENFIHRNDSPPGESDIKKAEKEIEDCKWAKGLQENGIEIKHLDTTINSPNSEFGPYEHNGKLYYSSVRYPTSNNFEAIPPLARIYSSKDNKPGMQVADDFNQDLETHTAHTAFNPDGNRMYYTICSNVNASEARCKIYYRDKNGDNWNPKQPLSSAINLEGYTSTQPSVGFDEDSGKEILFFVSDRLVDSSDVTKDLNIWCSFMEDGQFGAPAYIAMFNTPEDDVTPFFHTASQTLYFSSNGRQNMGGFDIYSIKKNGAGWESATHMGAPLNSSSDEMYYTINNEGSYGYMSSNRPGGSCDEGDSLCVCNDIYKVPQLQLEVRTFNKLTGKPLFGTKVALEDKELTDPDTQSKEDDHIYNYFIGFNRNYGVNGIKAGWIPDSQAFTTKGAKGGENKVIDLYLTPVIDLTAFTFDEMTGKALPGCKVELFEIEGAETSAAQQNAKSVDYGFALQFNKRYRVVASKEGYSSDSFELTTVLEEDNKGIKVKAVPTNLKDNLFLCRATETIKLYFFNDEPDRRSKDSISTISYSKAYNDYLTYKKDFDREWAYNKEERKKIDDFYEYEIKAGYANLEQFALTIYDYLQELKEGYTLKVIVRGYASPRAKNDYNLNLTKRRINSIRKYFSTCQNGLLAPYMDKILIVEEDPKGEDSAPEDVVDEKAGKRQSIYSYKASKERRVEIIEISCIPDEEANTKYK